MKIFKLSAYLLLLYIFFLTVIYAANLFADLIFYHYSLPGLFTAININYFNIKQFLPLFFTIYILGLIWLFLFKIKGLFKPLLLISFLFIFALTLVYIFYTPFVLTEMPTFYPSGYRSQTLFQTAVNLLMYKPKYHFIYLNFLISIFASVLVLAQRWHKDIKFKRVAFYILIATIIAGSSPFSRIFLDAQKKNNYFKEQKKHQEEVASKVKVLNSSYTPNFLKHKSDVFVESGYDNGDYAENILTYYSCNPNGSGNYAMKIVQTSLNELQNLPFANLKSLLENQGWGSNIQNLTVSGRKAIFFEKDLGSATLARIYFETADSRISIELNDQCANKGNLKEELLKVGNSLLLQS